MLSFSITRTSSVVSGVMVIAAGAKGETLEAATCAADVRNTFRCVTCFPPLVAVTGITAMTLAAVALVSAKLPVVDDVVLGSPASQAPLLLRSKQTVAPA